MPEYKIILQIISSSFAGQNLSEVFTQYTSVSEPNLNISKIKDISYGVVRYYNKLSLMLNTLVKKKIKDYQIQIILLIALYEINYTQKPSFAITNDLVNFSYLISNKLVLKNFVNAVIRNYLRKQDEICLKLKDVLEFHYNMPTWLIEKIKQDYPQNYIEIINNLNLLPKLALRVNLKYISFANYLELLNKANLKFDLIDNKIVLAETMNIRNIPLFAEGGVSIQDISAQKMIDLFNLNDNFYILDACSAPGGKACQILENYSVKLVALDINRNRLIKVQENLTRLNLSAVVSMGDATGLAWWDGKLFDIIIADVPCTASGTLKRNPDIKLTRKASDINNFVATQRKIILNLWPTLKVGGQLVYITCSIFKEENQLNIEYFIKTLTQMVIVKELGIIPTANSDGFYYCVLQKLDK